MKHIRFRFLTLLSVLALLTLCAVPVLANAETPPSFTILVVNAPEDLTMTYILPDGTEEPMRTRHKAWESYFQSYFTYEYTIDKAWGNDTGTFRLQSVSSALDRTIPAPEKLFSSYTGCFTLDLESGTFTVTNNLSRNALLVGLRVGITLATEALVLFCFSYRQRRSWTVFLLVNLVTQGLLNLAMTGFYPPGTGGYWVFLFYFAEVLIFAAESAAYAFLMREHTRRRAVLAAVCANAVSWAAGWWLLSNLPM